MKKSKFKHDWKFADMEEVKKAQLNELASLPLQKKLELLEQMQEVANHLNKSRKEKSELK